MFFNRNGIRALRVKAVILQTLRSIGGFYPDDCLNITVLKVGVRFHKSLKLRLKLYKAVKTDLDAFEYREIEKFKKAILLADIPRGIGLVY